MNSLFCSWGKSWLSLFFASHLFLQWPDLQNCSQLRATKRHLEEMTKIESKSNCQDDYQQVSLILLTTIKDVLQSRGYMSSSQTNSDDKTVTKVPFYAVPNLVRTRNVELSEGLALIPASKVKTVLRELYIEILSESLKRSKSTQYEEDDRRVDNLLKSVAQVFDHSVLTKSRSPTQVNVPPMKWKDVASSARLNFPPCFANLQTKLESRHRLGHHARVAYTLFLKEIGLGFEEAVKFWEHHYSAPGKDCSCSHSWQVWSLMNFISFALLLHTMT